MGHAFPFVSSNPPGHSQQQRKIGGGGMLAVDVQVGLLGKGIKASIYDSLEVRNMKIT